jgi:AcrR family transcriptional regulator
MVKRIQNEDLGRRERRKERTRKQIFRAAMRLFGQKGIFATTVEEITEAADVGKGTFFNYFPSKEAILSALAEHQLGVINKAVECAQTAESVRPVLKEMCKELSSVPGRSQILVRSLLGMVLSNRLMFELFQKVLSKGRARLALIVERGQNLGEIRRDIPASVIARCLQQAAFGTNFVWALSSPSDLMEWHERSMDLLWRGIATQPERVSVRIP